MTNPTGEAVAPPQARAVQAVALPQARTVQAVAP
jgi:hypothetical protein